jgi:hypothetical protein
MPRRERGSLRRGEAEARMVVMAQNLPDFIKFNIAIHIVMEIDFAVNTCLGKPLPRPWFG